MIHADVVVLDRAGEDANMVEEILRGSDTVILDSTDPRILDQILSNPAPLVSHASSALEWRNESKRTDVLVDAHKGPICWGVILDVTKTVQEGTTAVVVIKSGTVRLGQFFVAGSGFGKVTNIWSASAGGSLTHATPGMLVRIGRLVKNDEYTGDFAPDDNFFVFPKERAWRLAFHRQRIEWLNTFQTDGSKLDHVGFEMDANIENPRFDDRRAPTDDVGQKGRLQEYLESNGSILVSPVSERAERESGEVEKRWKSRQEARIEAKKLAMKFADSEKKEMHKLRQLIHKGVVEEETREDIEAAPISASTESARTLPAARPLPVSAPVIPVIAKTKSVSQFDALLDELEILEEEFSVKIPVVHGGIGPVSPTDVVHAEIESKYSPCCVYVVGGAGVLPQATSNAGIEVVNMESVDEMISHVRDRILALKRRVSRRRYLGKLKNLHS